MKTPRSKPQAASFGEEGDFVLFGGTGTQASNSFAQYDASLGAFRNNRKTSIKMVGHCVRKVNENTHIVATKGRKTYLFNTNTLVSCLDIWEIGKGMACTNNIFSFPRHSKGLLIAKSPLTSLLVAWSIVRPMGRSWLQFILQRGRQ